MDQKVVASMFAAVVIGVLTWMANTTLELKLAVQRLEIILLDDSMKK